MKCKSKRKGFTLVEVLAVIVVIAVIAAITIPTVRNIMGAAKKDAFSLAALKVLEAVYEENLIDDYFDSAEINVDNLKERLKISNPNYKAISISQVAEGEFYVYIEGQGKWKNLVACGVSDAITVGDGSNCNGDVPHIPGGDQPGGNDPGIPPFNGTVNPPALAKGMTPIKWVENGEGVLEVVQTDVNDPDWYEYGTTEGTRRWANAQTEDGSFWVWIPRYAYQIEKCHHMNESQCQTATGKKGGQINIKFLKEMSNKSANDEDVDILPIYNGAGTEQLNFIVHPAFKFGTKELTGFWVAKFEVSPDNNSDCYYTSSPENCNELETIGSIIPKIVPGVKSWRNIQIGHAFLKSRKMETLSNYGWNQASGYQEEGSLFGVDNNNIDVHMLKNTEWGAVAYLGQSEYGKNARIALNLNSSYYTGGGSENAYLNNGNQSTTGNVYGVYDMSGGADEFVAAYLESGDSTYLALGSFIIDASDKYKNIYKGYYGPRDTNAIPYQIWGDAVWETSSKGDPNSSYSWYGEYSSFLHSSIPWFKRGGNWWESGSSGSFFYERDEGSTTSFRDKGWRVALLVGEGL